MKKFAIFLINSFIITLCFSDSSSHSSADQRNINQDTVSSGIFLYKITGDYENGTEALYFKKNKIYRHKKTRITFSKKYDYMAPLDDTVYIQNDDGIFLFDITNKKGKKIPNYFNEKTGDNSRMYQMFQNNLLNPVTYIFKPLIDKYGTDNKQETVTFFGKQCRVIRSSFFVVYYWNDFILRKEILKPYKMVKEITSLSVNAKIPDSRFFPLSYIKATPVSSDEMDTVIKSVNDFISSNSNNVIQCDLFDLFLNKLQNK